MKIAKPNQPLIVCEKCRLNVQRRIAQERVPTPRPSGACKATPITGPHPFLNPACYYCWPLIAGRRPGP